MMDTVVRNDSHAGRVDAAAVRLVLRDLAEALGSAKSCAVVFIGDKRMRRYNLLYRSMNRTTDVLSFSSDEEDSMGDLVISLPMAIEQARERGHAADEEIRLLITHGFLHLLGHDHQKDRGEMRRRERELMKSLPARPILRQPPRATARAR